MSSTVLLIMLVVVWLFVLGPLVINSRDQIRRTNDALGQTRVLHRGGSAAKARRRRLGPLPGEQVGTVDATIDEDERIADDVFEDDDEVRYVRGGRCAYAQASSVERVAEADLRDEYDTDDIVDVDIVDDYDDELAYDEPSEDELAATAGYGIYENSTDYLVVADEDGQPLSADAAPLWTVAESDEADAVAELDTDESAADLEDLQDTDDAATSVDAQADVEDDAVATDDSDAELLESEYDEEAEGAEAVVEDELSDADLAFAEKRRGRGGFDPEADRRYTTSRYQRRQRTLLGLVGVTLAAVLVAFFSPVWAWAIPAVTGLITVAYVVMLRQVTLAERELRRRRIQQMRRARLGVETSLQREFDVTPAHLRRPGAVVVEVDDEDPIFDALDDYEAPYGYVDQSYYRSA